MTLFDFYDVEKVGELAHEFFAEKKTGEKLTGWFLTRELVSQYREQNPGEISRPLAAARALRYAIERLPLDISSRAVFAGTQADAFSESYALINPAFKVEEFSGYCDPVAIYHDLKPDGEITASRIEAQRKRDEDTDYVRALKKVYRDYETYTPKSRFLLNRSRAISFPISDRP